ncbi:MAG: YceI family protein [Bacteroidia bacterium]|nr:YceI family protein [Bacteroidia bacterium]
MKNKTCPQNFPTVFFCLLFLCMGAKISAQKINMANRYQINKDGSFIQFKTTMAGFPVIRGALKAYQATIFYDPNDVMKSSATIRLGSAGFSTAHDKRDVELQGAHFLNTAEFPGIWFQGTEVTPTEKGFELKGTLNIKDISKTVSLQIETPSLMRGAMNGMDLMIVKGDFAINRKDFQLGTSGDWASNPMLGDQIDIEFTFLCSSYTLGFLKNNFIRKLDDRDHAVGLVYEEVKNNGLDSGMKLLKELMKDKRYKADNWLNNLADIGWILMVDGLGKESLPFYEMALKKNPAHMSSLLRLGDAYTIAGEYDHALAHFKKERALAERARFTHIPHMIRLLSNSFDLKNMK